MDDREVLKKFGLNLKIERTKKGITQEELAEMIDVHEKYISKIETGKQNVTIKTLNKLSSALGVDMHKFLIF
jgi:transcriptional regulator with XRE-family HTH domain